MSGITNEDYSGSPFTVVPPCKSFGCNQNLSSLNPASQYQRLKIIQNTVRVPSSLYSMNLGALNVYQKPFPLYNVNWNQMSDRRERHIQPNIVTGGSFYHGSSTKSTITRCRPGAGSPGGSGVDIKHNSYDRYLNRIKGKGPVRRGPIPPGFGTPLANLDLNVQGGKTMKTSIVAGCNCPIVPDDAVREKEALLYTVLLSPLNFNVNYVFSVGQQVYAILLEQGQNYYAQAVITAINDGVYTIQFQDGTIGYRTANNLLVYFPCNCNNSDISEYLASGNFVLESDVLLPCFLLSNFIGGGNYVNILQQFFGNNAFFNSS